MKKIFLYKKRIGTSQQELLFERETELDFLKFDFLKTENQILILSSKKIFLAEDGEFVDFLDSIKKGPFNFYIQNAQDIIYKQKSNSLFILENNGTNIKRIRLDVSLSHSLNEENQLFLKKAIKNQSNISAHFCSINRTFFISMDKSNSLFEYKDEKVKRILGNGYPDYSVSSNKNNSQINNPMGLMNNKGKLFFCDYGNHCIRSLGNNINLELGNPLKKDIKPVLLGFYNDNIFFLSDNAIFNKKMMTYRGINKILDFKIRENHMYILEELNEK